MYIAIIMLPMLSAISAGLGGRYIGERGAKVLTTIMITVASVISWVYLIKYASGLGQIVEIKLWTWVETGRLLVDVGVLYDGVTLIMLVLVTTVSGLVHLYSTEYMSGDPHVTRFMAYLSLFTLMMIILVTANNYMQMFIGWEGVGVCSYLLINFWYTRIQANKSAMQAMIMNRIGDVGLCIGMYIIYKECGSLNYDVVFSVIGQGQVEEYWITWIGVSLLIGAVGKSAQIGLHTWLPTAMEGPTPVSALIHAATMVTAGVFILIRSSPILEYTPTALGIIMLVGAMTAILAASIGLVQNDIKRVIAYSTCSQLGYMVMAVGASNYSVGLFHLFNHGFFKAGLFLSAGAIIHAIGDEQDMRKYGSLRRALPMTYGVILIASLSLMGWPFLTGFYSKDAILELLYAKYSVQATFSYWLGVVAAMMTAYYSFRLIFMTFIGPVNTTQEKIKNVHESPWQMSLPLILLAIGSIFIGYIMKDAIIGLGSNFMGQSIYVKPTMLDNMIDAEQIEILIKWTPILLSIIGASLAMWIGMFEGETIYKVVQKRRIANNIYTFLINKWNFDQVYNKLIGKPVMKAGLDLTYKLMDRGYIELLGPEGISRGVKEMTKRISSTQSGWIYSYAFTMLTFATLVVAMLYMVDNPIELVGNWRLDIIISLIVYLVLN